MTVPTNNIQQNYDFTDQMEYIPDIEQPYTPSTRNNSMFNPFLGGIGGLYGIGGGMIPNFSGMRF